MTVKNPLVSEFPIRVQSQSGLGVEFNANGSIRRMDVGDIVLNLFPGNEIEGGPANLYLRRHGERTDFVALLGPASPSAYDWDATGISAVGDWEGIRYHLRFSLAQDTTAWFWHLELENTGNSEETWDVILAQDLALAHYGAIRLNEYYVSQYIDHTALRHPAVGWVVASRQNQSMGGNFPWTAIGCLDKASAYATDALQVHGLATRNGFQPKGIIAGLPSKRLQHEHSMVAVQSPGFVIAPNAHVETGFFGTFHLHHPEATTEDDLQRVDAILAHPLARASAPEEPAVLCLPVASHFTLAPRLVCRDLDEIEISKHFPGPRRHEEVDAGKLLSFFGDAHEHVVLKSKETMVLRPHGHLLRSGSSMIPDEAALTSTCWMNGVFHSMVTQGHVSINRFLSTCHSYLGLFRSHGQRVFMEIDGLWHLLDQPSAFEMCADSCRWIYRHAGGVIQATARASETHHVLTLELEILQGPPARFLLSHHVALHGDDGTRTLPVCYEHRNGAFHLTPAPDCDVGWRFPDGYFTITPTACTEIQSFGGDELLFEDGVSRKQPYFCLITYPATAASVEIRGNLVDASATFPDGFWQKIALNLKISAPITSSLAPAASRIEEVFPWFIQNALVHYLSPRGLEQYSGGGWGTRDVCQGAAEMLFALGSLDSVRDLLLRVFRQQNPDGDWPQWFMFFERERNIRPGDSHGDIVYWPVLALAQYLIATGDAALLNENVPFFHQDAATAPTAPLRQHVERALAMMENRVIQGTHLAAYGHGDWNDALQPAQPDMREHLCSSWTVTLNYQTLTTLATAMRTLGKPDEAAPLEARAAAILAEFQKTLVVDGVITGFAYFQQDGEMEQLLHPQDTRTGLKFSVLPMIHAIMNDMLTPEQAAHHFALIQKHLSGPDGAHLFDRPLAYHGGPQTFFQRAESASYFGREIGIMYTHAHLRYAEALARFGDSRGFFRALCQANPIGVRQTVPSATLRQANCYYSSSDPAFSDRYEAFKHYDRVRKGDVPLEGGWRVYSSGAGIGVRLLLHAFLGLKLESAHLIIDPVMPPELDGLKVSLCLAGLSLRVTYLIGSNGCGPQEIQLNGRSIAFEILANPYRAGAARIPISILNDLKPEETQHLNIVLG